MGRERPPAMSTVSLKISRSWALRSPRRTLAARTTSSGASMVPRLAKPYSCSRRLRASSTVSPSPTRVTSAPRACSAAPVSRSMSFRLELACPRSVCAAPGSSNAILARGRSGGLKRGICSTVPRMRTGETLADLVQVMKRLLAPDGCPWDREQTLHSLKPFLLEETYEVLEALEEGTAAEHCE